MVPCSWSFKDNTYEGGSTDVVSKSELLVLMVPLVGLSWWVS